MCVWARVSQGLGVTRCEAGQKDVATREAYSQSVRQAQPDGEASLRLMGTGDKDCGRGRSECGWGWPGMWTPEGDSDGNKDSREDAAQHRGRDLAWWGSGASAFQLSPHLVLG